MARGLKHVAVLLVAGGVLATPAAAQEEANGYPITDVNLRAGPGTEYPVLVTVLTDAPITILGCLEDYAWCDIIFEEHRGWMRSIYLAGYYDGEYYLLSDYAPDLGYQTVTFDVAAYWNSNYRDEPFYNDQHRVAEPRGEDWVDDGVFYDRLSPHGSWTWTQGQYVWVPTGVDASWRPYTRGRWVYTDYGWTWASNEPFGWATYHYGRWGFSNRIGWFWVPGNRWGPAWVSWRQSDDYLAWAPLPPAYDRGLSVNVSFGNIPGYYWSVVPSLYFLSDDLPRYYVRDRDRWRRAYDRTRPIGHTTIVNKTVVNKVVNVTYVERHTNKKVVERKVRRTRDWDRAGKVHGDDYEVYRPGLGEGRGRHRPDRPRDIDEVAKVSETKALARGEATTEDMLAPPEVREAIKKRTSGKLRGEQSSPGQLSRDEPGTKFHRSLPKGEDAEGPPPAAKKARTEPVPAHDLGRSQTGSKHKPGRQEGPTEDRGGRAISAPDKEKGPPSTRIKGPKGETPADVPAEAGKERRRADPQGPAPRLRHEDEARAKPTADQDAKGKQKDQPRERKAFPDGKPGGPQGPSDRKPAAKKAPPKQEAEHSPPQAQQEKPRGSEKKVPPKQESEPKKENAPPQARSNTDSGAKQPSPDGKSNNEKNKGKKKKKKDE